MVRRTCWGRRKKTDLMNYEFTVFETTVPGYNKHGMDTPRTVCLGDRRTSHNPAPASLRMIIDWARTHRLNTATMGRVL